MSIFVFKYSVEETFLLKLLKNSCICQLSFRYMYVFKAKPAIYCVIKAKPEITHGSSVDIIAAAFSCSECGPLHMRFVQFCSEYIMNM